MLNWWYVEKPLGFQTLKNGNALHEDHPIHPCIREFMSETKLLDGFS